MEEDSKTFLITALVAVGIERGPMNLVLHKNQVEGEPVICLFVSSPFLQFPFCFSAILKREEIEIEILNPLEVGC